jgi:hypothetical protein
MRFPSPGVCVLVLVTVSQVRANSVGLAPGPVGERVRVQIASEYHTEGIDVSMGRLEARGEDIQQDRSTLTVTLADASVRYPAPGAVLVGRLEAFDDKSLTVDLGDGKMSVTVPRVAIRSLKVSRGGSARARTGAVIGGLLVGMPAALVGAGIGALGNLDCEYHCSSRPGLVLAGVGLGVGAFVGAGLGVGLSGGERWERVSIGVGPRSRKGIAVALSVRF